jgi:hypothetical protein
MSIRLFFEYKGLVVQLPVNPESLAVGIKGGNKTTEVVNLGEVNLINLPKLSIIKLDSFFPNDSAGPYVVTKGRFDGPEFYINFFENIQKEKQPCRFIVSDTRVNMLVTIEDLTYAYVHGTNDIEYAISLKEYKVFKARTVILTTNTTTDTTVANVATVDRPKTGFAIGDSVTVSGKYWASSYGDSPSNTFNKFNGKISHIVSSTSRAYRYHITNITGGAKGWVAESQISHT